MDVLVFPGRFDPFTIAHFDIVNRALKISKKVIILVFDFEEQKKPMFTLEQRIRFVEKIFSGNKNVIIEKSLGMLVDYLQKNNLTHVIRGIRNNEDLSWEQYIHNVNKALYNDFETIYLLSSPANQHISSSVVRMLIKNKKELTGFIPEIIEKDVWQN